MTVETTLPLLQDRRKEYGDFRDHAAITQQLKGNVATHREMLGRPPLNAVHNEAMDMILHKIGRIVNGNPDNIDSWGDIAGYALRVVEHLREAKK